MTQDLAARLDALEIHIAHQDQAIEEMNAVILAQREEIARLTRRLDKMHNRIADVEDHMPAPESKKPPHW